jgi:hypothetical protein
VAVPGPDLIDRDFIGIESHQVSILPAHPPASIVGVDRRRFPNRAAQLLVGRAYSAFGSAQGIPSASSGQALGDGSLSQLQPRQSLQHRWHFSYRNPNLIVEGMDGGHDSLAYSVGSGPILVRSQVRMLAPHPLATPEATADPHSVLGHLGAGQCR